MQICTLFNPDLMWREQFIPLMGQEEVTKLDNKLKSLNVAGKYFNKEAFCDFGSTLDGMRKGENFD